MAIGRIGPTAVQALSANELISSIGVHMQNQDELFLDFPEVSYLNILETTISSKKPYEQKKMYIIEAADDFGGILLKSIWEKVQKIYPNPVCQLATDKVFQQNQCNYANVYCFDSVQIKELDQVIRLTKQLFKKHTSTSYSIQPKTSAPIPQEYTLVKKWKAGEAIVSQLLSSIISLIPSDEQVVPTPLKWTPFMTNREGTVVALLNLTLRETADSLVSSFATYSDYPFDAKLKYHATSGKPIICLALSQEDIQSNFGDLETHITNIAEIFKGKLGPYTKQELEKTGAVPLTKFFENEKERLPLVGHIQSINDFASFLIQGGDPERAANLLEGGVGLIELIDKHFGTIRKTESFLNAKLLCFMRLAGCYGQTGQEEKSKPFLLKALELAKEIKDQEKENIITEILASLQLT